VLCLLYHLIINQELYQDDLISKPRDGRNSRIYPNISISFDEMIGIITKAGYEVRRKEDIGGG